MSIFKIFSRGNISKAISVEATVAAKQDRDEGWHGRGGDEGVGRSAGMIPTARIMPIRPVYRITFEFAERQSVQLQVSGKVYKSLSVGSKGVLVYSYKTFRKFHVDKTLAEIINPDDKSSDFRKGFNKKNNKK